jgi:transposase InsO family protein
MIYLFIYEFRSTFRVKKMALVLKVSRSGYYEWVKTKKTKREIDDELFLVQIKETFEKTRKTYGPRRITKALNNEGIKIGRKSVERIMKENNIVPITVKKFKATTNSNHDYPISPNLLNRQFNVDAPCKAWVTDITYVHTDEGWLYLAAVMDLYSGKIVGWAMDSTMTQQLVINALKQAIGRANPPRGVLCHSDRGVQYASKKYRRILAFFGFKQSMSRKGNCWDNACMESFFGTLKTELVYHERYKTRTQARLSIFDYIETFYNRIRLHSKLGYQSPENYEKERISA